MQTEITQTIIQKIPLLSEDEQKRVLEEIELFLSRKNGDLEHIKESQIHPLTQLARIQIDFKHDDLAENNDFYAHRRVEE